MIKVAILGSTSHIAKGLIHHFSQDPQYSVSEFSRSKNNLHNFYDFKFDCVINCIGVGTYREDFNPSSYFHITEHYDDFIIQYLHSYSDCLYINFSSGSVHIPFDVNDIRKEDFGKLAKLNSEAKHRSYPNLNIVDLRLYSYFSRFANLNDNYFMNDIIKCVLYNKTFTTNIVDFIRDYIHPEDLYYIIKKCIDETKMNRVIDVGSLHSISKKGILDYFTNNYNLKIEYTDNLNYHSLTGEKTNYFPGYFKQDLDPIGKVKYSSYETIKMESDYFLRSI